MLRLTLLLCAAASTALLAPSRSARADDAGGAVVVHIESDQPVELFRRLQVPGRKPSEATSVCSAPCDQPIETRPDAVFFVDSAEMPSSRAFPLDRVGPVRVAVNPGSFEQRIGGGFAIGFGGAGIVAGVTALIVNSWRDVQFFPGGERGETPSDDGLVIGGGVGIGLGAGLVALGIALVATSGTKLDVADAVETAGSPLRFSF